MEENIPVIRTGKIYEMLELIRKLNGSILTDKSITALQNFLNGYRIFHRGNELYNDSEKDFNEFELALSVKENHQGGKHNIFSEVLLRHNNGDEEKAFDNFFELLDKFKYSN